MGNNQAPLEDIGSMTNCSSSKLLFPSLSGWIPLYFCHEESDEKHSRREWMWIPVGSHELTKKYRENSMWRKEVSIYDIIDGIVRTTHSTKSWTKYLTFDFRWQTWLANNLRISPIQFIEADDLRVQKNISGSKSWRWSNSCSSLLQHVKSRRGTLNHLGRRHNHR